MSAGSRSCQKRKQVNCAGRFLSGTSMGKTSITCPGQSPLCSDLTPPLKTNVKKVDLIQRRVALASAIQLYECHFCLVHINIPLFLSVVMFCFLNFICWIPFGI